MVKYKKIFIIGILTGILIFLGLSIFKIIDPFYVDDGKNRIYDEAGLLTEDEKLSLSKKINKYSQKRNLDIVIYTANEDYTDEVKIMANEKYIDNVQVFANEFHDSLDGGKHNPYVMLTINMYDRDVNVTSYNSAENNIDVERATKIRKYITPSLSEGDYYKAFDKFINKSYKYLGIRLGVNPDSIFLNDFILIIISFIVGLFGIGSMLAEVRFNKKPKLIQIDASLANIVDKKDNYIRTSTTKTRIVKNDNSSGGGGSFGGGSSGSTSGGSSYSGSSGKF